MGSRTLHDPSQLLSMDDFTNFKQIGKGKDCIVYSATCEKLGGASVVLKVYDKAKISAIKHRSVRREARIMRYLTEKRIPHTTAYTGAFQDSKQIYIVMEHCKGGDLLEQLLKEGRAMPEKRVVREVVLPTLTALAYLHAAGIIHRDIKLENLFISSKGHLQLGDFGLAICVLEERAISPVGTLEYMSPEILRLPSTDIVIKGLVRVEDIMPIDEKVDIWSFGVTVYELVTGRSPFEGASKDDIKAAILGFQMRPLPGFLSPGCQDFILKSLCPKACDRPGALALLNHPWVQMHCTAADLVMVAKLPLQLPKVPMGYKQPSGAKTAVQLQQQLQQQAPAMSQPVSAAAAYTAGASVGPATLPESGPYAQSSCSMSVATHAAPAAAGGMPGASTADLPAPAVPAACVIPADTATGKAIQPELQSPEPKLQANSSTPSTPDSPQIPAFLPPGTSGQPMRAALMSNNSTGTAMSAISSGSHADSGHSTVSSSSSHSSNLNSMPSSHALSHINCTTSCDSVRSNRTALLTGDMALLSHSPGVAGAASGSDMQHGVGSSSNKAWAAAAAAVTGAGLAGAAWPQEPIQESPSDESAAAVSASSVAGTCGSTDAMVSLKLQEQQQQLDAHLLQSFQQPMQQPLQALSQQKPQQDLQNELMAHVSQHALPQHTGGHEHLDGGRKVRKTNSKKLFKWMCIAAGAASPNDSFN